MLYVLKENYDLSYIEIAKLLENGDVGLNESVIGRIVRDVSKKRQKTTDIMYNNNSGGQEEKKRDKLDKIDK